jgi:hypothetical protein
MQHKAIQHTRGCKINYVRVAIQPYRAATDHVP